MLRQSIQAASIWWKRLHVVIQVTTSVGCFSWTAIGLSSNDLNREISGPCTLLSSKTLFPRQPNKLVPGLLRDTSKKILRLREGRDFETEKKTNFADLKTKGDCTSQVHIFKALHKHYPSHALFGEEKCAKVGEDEPTSTGSKKVLWILDPIDGTTNYAHGLSHFSISLALVIGEEICYGAVFAPIANELFYATRGNGAYLTKGQGAPLRLSVSKIDKFASSLWVTGFKAGKQDKVDRNLPIMREVLLRTHGVRRPGSAALDLAHVAAGRIEGYWELFMDWWDIAAGLLLVEEAGGKTFVIRASQSKTAEATRFSIPTLAVMASNGNSQVHNTMRALLEEKL